MIQIAQIIFILSVLVILHEFGHYILHQKLSIGQIEYNTFEDYSFPKWTKGYF